LPGKGEKREKKRGKRFLIDLQSWRKDKPAVILQADVRKRERREKRKKQKAEGKTKDISARSLEEREGGKEMAANISLTSERSTEQPQEERRKKSPPEGGSPAKFATRYAEGKRKEERKKGALSPMPRQTVGKRSYVLPIEAWESKR